MSNNYMLPNYGDWIAEVYHTEVKPAIDNHDLIRARVELGGAIYYETFYHCGVPPDFKGTGSFDKQVADAADNLEEALRRRTSPNKIDLKILQAQRSLETALAQRQTRLKRIG